MYLLWDHGWGGTAGWSLLTWVLGVSALENPPTEYLSEEAWPRIVFHTQGWGELGLNTCTHAPGVEALPMRIKDRQYRRGLGTHAPAETLIDLNGQYLAFEAEVGVQPQPYQRGSVVFQVFVDGEKRFDSGVMREQDEARPVRVAVAGAEELRLVVTDAGDGIHSDCAHWANARLVRDPQAKLRPPPEPFDIAPFARVVTSDPARVEGARSGRLEEFRPEDVFLEWEIAPDADGSYTVPTFAEGRGSIGLQWAERRVLTEATLQFAEGTPSPEGAELQYWSSEGRQDSWGEIGQTWWQGRWERLPAEIEAHGDRWTVRFPPDLPEFRNWVGLHKIRWLFPPMAQPIRVRRLSAFTPSRWMEGDFRLELDPPRSGQRVRLEVYNGAFLEPAATGGPFHREWDLAAPLTFRLRYSRPRPWKSDRTVLRVSLPEGGFGVDMEEVAQQGFVYVPDFGVWIARQPAPVSLAEYRQQIAGRQTLLERVRQLPDQTLSQARSKLREPLQNNDPMMLSLACDNAKWVVSREGTLQLATTDPEATQYLLLPYEVRPRFGSGRNEGLTRHLEGGWLPAPVLTVQDGGIVYRQRTFVVPLDKGARRLNPKPLGVVEFTLENPQPQDNEACLAIACVRVPRTEDGGKEEPILPRPVPSGWVFEKADGHLLAFAEAGEAAPLRATVQDGALRLQGTLSAQGRARCFLYLPAWDLLPEEYASLQGRPELMGELAAYWQDLLAPAMQVELPEPLLMDLYRASQVHILMAARNVGQGAEVAAWISADRYGPLDTEAHAPILGMDLLGHHDFARRSLEYFIHRYHPQGFLARGYTVVGTGQHLWTLAQHYALTQDREWLQKVAPQVARACRWIVQQREKTQRLDPRGEKLPEYGLLPPGVLADWNRYAYYFYANGYYQAGLEAAAQALAEVGVPEAQEWLAEAQAYRQDILRAYRWNQARMPVLPLANGTWVPATPSSLYCFGLTSHYYGGVSAIGHDVEVGGNHLIPQGVIAPDSRDAEWIANYLEDAWFFIPGLAGYPEGTMREDWFNFGGFSKLQPYYTRIADIHALRDDVKPFLRTYFNSIFPFLSEETLALWEHFRNLGGWNKTHETGWFLQQTRTLLVMERGDELWLAPFIPNQWLKEGMAVAVRRAPTRFGPVSYRITSHVAAGVIEAVIEPPTRPSPQALVLRLRHPEEKPMQRVTVNGQPHLDFDPQKECIRLKPEGRPLMVRAEYTAGTRILP